MKLSSEEVQRIALLARMGLSEAETEKFRSQLSDILQNFEILQEVETSEILPTAHVTEMGNVMREDQTEASFPQNEILANAPQEEEGFFRVKAVLE